MLGSEIIVKITRKSSEIDDTTNKYLENIIYENLNAKIQEIKRQIYKTEISQNDDVQEYALFFDKNILNIKIWDIVSYSDLFWEKTLKLSTNPKMIEFEEDENFIKVIAKLIW